MPVIAGFDRLTSLPEEQISTKFSAASHPASKPQWSTENNGGALNEEADAMAGPISWREDYGDSESIWPDIRAPVLMWQGCDGKIGAQIAAPHMSPVVTLPSRRWGTRQCCSANRQNVFAEV